MSDFNYTGDVPAASNSETELKLGYIALGYDGPNNYIYSLYKNQEFVISPSNLYNEAYLSDCLSPAYLRNQAVVAGLDISRDLPRSFLKDIGNKISESCANAGVYKASKVRGSGVYQDPNDPSVLIINGRTLTRTDGKTQSRVTEDSIYVNDLDINLALAKTPATLEDAQLIMSGLRAWNYKKNSDADLLLGVIGNMWVNGALDWRAHPYFVGDGGAGKSELQKLAHSLTKPVSRYTTGLSEAALRSLLKRAPLTVFTDEFEAKGSGTTQQENMLELMTKASSGGVIMKATQHQTVIEYRVEMCIAAGGVNPPSMTAATASRIIPISLDAFGNAKSRNIPFFADKREGSASAKEAERLGYKLGARMFSMWNEFRSAVRMIRSIIMDMSDSSRFADTYGTAIASSWILQHDEELTEERAKEWVDYFALDTKIEDAKTAMDSEIALNHLLDTIVQSDSGKRMSIGDLAVAAATLARDSDMNKGTLSRYGMRADLKDGKVEITLHPGNIEFERLFAQSCFGNAQIGEVLKRNKGTQIKKSVRIGSKISAGISIPTNLFFEPTSVRTTVKESTELDFSIAA